MPRGNAVTGNSVGSISVVTKGVLAWDGAGGDNCFDSNEITDLTEPDRIQELYACKRRPFTGEPYEPVRQDLAEALPSSLALETADPPEPDRPSCQKGRPGCRSG